MAALPQAKPAEIGYDPAPSEGIRASEVLDQHG